MSEGEFRMTLMDLCFSIEAFEQLFIFLVMWSAQTQDCVAGTSFDDVGREAFMSSDMPTLAKHTKHRCFDWVNFFATF